MGMGMDMDMDMDQILGDSGSTTTKEVVVVAVNAARDIPSNESSRTFICNSAFGLVGCVDGMDARWLSPTINDGMGICVVVPSYLYRYR